MPLSQYGKRDAKRGCLERAIASPKLLKAGPLYRSDQQLAGITGRPEFSVGQFGDGWRTVVSSGCCVRYAAYHGKVGMFRLRPQFFRGILAALAGASPHTPARSTAHRYQEAAERDVSAGNYPSLAPSVGGVGESGEGWSSGRLATVGVRS